MRLILLLILFSSCSHQSLRRPSQDNQSAEITSGANGQYLITGTNTLLGNYSGVAWVRDGVVQRKVDYHQYKNQGNTVESIWTGKVGEQSFDFSLTLSTTLTKYESFEPSADSFKKPVIVSLPLEQNDFSTQEFSFSINGEGSSREVWTRTGEASAQPLWKDLRTSVVGVGKDHSLIEKVSKLIGIQEVINMYHDLPEVQPYKDRPEFKEAKQYFITDKTDADFYLNNSKILRITNKTINPLSLAEATMKKNAYGHTLAWKAQYLGNQTATSNFNSAGFLENTIVNEKDEKIGREMENDTALWTSMFGWSELMRYKIDHDPKALANFNKILDGVLRLVEITGDVHEFARGIAEATPEEDLGKRWVQGEGKYSHLKWRQGGNNDMLKGIFLTLSLAHQVVDVEDAQLVSRIKAVAKNLYLQNSIGKGFNLGIAKGLDALWNKDEKAFSTSYNSLHSLMTMIGDATELGAGFYYGGIADWSGVNLTLLSNLSQLVLSSELQKKFPGEKAKRLKEDSEDRLFLMMKIYKNAHRDFLTIMTYAFSEKAQKDIEFREMAREAIWTLKEIPAPRFVGNAAADMKKHPEWSMSAWPRLPWKALEGFRKLKKEPVITDLYEGATSYPLYEGHAWESTFIWKDNPFAATYNSNAKIQTFSSDYLLVYWAARSSGLISADE